MRTFCLILCTLLPIVTGLGSMSSIAISYGENGPAFCGIKSDGSHLATCYGSNSAVTYGTPPRFPFTGLTAGDGFVCGLLMDSAQPYCWGTSAYIKMGVPQPMVDNAEFTEISAGDYHLCGLRKPIAPRHKSPFFSIVDCWGYNMTKTFVFEGELQSISAGSDFNCGVFTQNRTAFCWGDETSSHVMRLTPKYQKFLKIAAGGYHVCGILESSRVFCWGRSLDLDKEFSVNDLPPSDPMLAIVGGKFHACGIRSLDRGVTCWGFIVKPSTPVPTGVQVYELAAGNYFTCGIMALPSLLPLCWGVGFPTSLPVAISAGVCSSSPCTSGSYELTGEESSCKLPGSHACVPCSDTCPAQMHLTSVCTTTSDRVCEYNCSSCVTSECFSNCSTSRHVGNDRKFWALQLPVLIAEASFVVLLVIIVFATAVLYVRNKLKDCRCSVATRSSGSRGPKRVRPGIDEMKIRRAHMYTYEELAQATDGFKEESLVGKGSFSCVYKGVLKDGTVVAVKKAIVNSDKQKNSKEFHNELDLLSRLNHAHLLNLLGYCEESGERLLVYEFMANGSLHQHLHGKKTVLDWVRRVTIAVQAARGIEYLHGYACPPVIHRDIKSSNILIDEEHNARVADFGLSLMGPADSGSPLAELPAGTLGYLDPEYYRLHYLTTKSDVYSFGVLLLEILSGRKAIDMQYEEGNIVEWAVPLIKAGDVAGVLDEAVEAPTDMEALTRIAHVACRCVRMRGKERPSMDKVTTALERALAQLMGGSILPTEVVLGSSRLHKKSSSNRSNSGPELRAPSWITFPSVTLSSSQRRKSSASEADMQRICGSEERRLEEEIGPASPRENLFLQHNF